MPTDGLDYLESEKKFTQGYFARRVSKTINLFFLLWNTYKFLRQ